MEFLELEKELEAFQYYLKEKEYSNKTISKYVKDIKKMFSYMGTNLVNKERLKQYKDYLMKQYKPSSVNSYIISVNVFMKWLGKSEWVLRTVRLQRKTCMEKVISKQEYEKMLILLYHRQSWRNYMIIRMLAMTGMRVGELQYVTVEVIEQGKITIYKKGKYREICIQESLVRMLKKYCENENIQEGYLFFGKDKCKPLDSSAIWKMLKKTARDAGVDEEKVYPHSFRHLFAKTYMKEIGNVLELADILGHSNIETTRIYTLTSMEEKRKALEKLGL